MYCYILTCKLLPVSLKVCIIIQLSVLLTQQVRQELVPERALPRVQPESLGLVLGPQREVLLEGAGVDRPVEGGDPATVRVQVGVPAKMEKGTFQ